ncbi:hypothetical protein RSOL_066180, partial [Rhizoctonia solani AG-3 Rhs1AP]
MRKYVPTIAESNLANSEAGSEDEYQDDESHRNEEIDHYMHDGAAGANDLEHEEDIEALTLQTSNLSAQELEEDTGNVKIPFINDTGNHTYDSDNARSNYSCGSWYHVPTPIPSPPHSPPPEQDDHEPSDDEDGFRNVNAQDFREFERWYAEDYLGKDVEMLAETLTYKEPDSSIIILTIQQFGGVTQSDYERI